MGEGAQAGNSRIEGLCRSLEGIQAYVIHNGVILKYFKYMDNIINWDFKKSLFILEMELQLVHETEFGETSQEDIAKVRSEQVQTMAVAEEGLGKGNWIHNIYSMENGKQ